MTKCLCTGESLLIYERLGINLTSTFFIRNRTSVSRLPPSENHGRLLGGKPNATAVSDLVTLNLVKAFPGAAALMIEEPGLVSVIMQRFGSLALAGAVGPTGDEMSAPPRENPGQAAFCESFSPATRRKQFATGGGLGRSACHRIFLASSSAMSGRYRRTCSRSLSFSDSSSAVNGKPICRSQRDTSPAGSTSDPSGLRSP